MFAWNVSKVQKNLVPPNNELWLSLTQLCTWVNKLSIILFHSYHIPGSTIPKIILYSTIQFFHTANKLKSTMQIVTTRFSPRGSQPNKQYIHIRQYYTIWGNYNKTYVGESLGLLKVHCKTHKRIKTRRFAVEIL